MNFYNILVKILSSFFFVGYLPLIPGTFGSLAGILLIYCIGGNTSNVYLPFLLFLICIGYLVCTPAEKLMQKKDPKFIVIDEVCGMLISLLFIPFQTQWVIAAFLLFRILDTIKPYPAGQLERLKGSLGIMGDDIVAGIYTNIILQVVLRFTLVKAS
ncbi:MAG: phosphatidylglycerophosphatase A [Candidatus Omnitrophica bacterium]|nr:phosphatidylglycerophosphatase A [Candidatus Omnitrophota bacterium]